MIELCHRLLDADAPVNLPDGKPSTAIHCCVNLGSAGVLRHMLEPHRNPFVSHMPCFQRGPGRDYGPGLYPKLRTPVQLAAELGRVNLVRMLSENRADVNEPPASRFGRTALQAATSSYNPNLELVQFLVDRRAAINAPAGSYGGVPALQGAAISGNIMVTKFLIEMGADVNAPAAISSGRYAIEGVAEHGRLDIVRLFLNAGAKGNVSNETGFASAIELALKEGRVVFAEYLRAEAEELMRPQEPPTSGPEFPPQPQERDVVDYFPQDITSWTEFMENLQNGDPDIMRTPPLIIEEG